MTITEFIEKYDHEHSIILLEGKRNIAEKDKLKLIKLGRILATKTKQMIFRSGNAEGADFFFSQGVAMVDNSRLQVIIPYNKHRQKTNKAYKTYSLDDVDLAAEPEVVYQSKQNKKAERLIDQYVAGDVNRNSIKAAYLLRDTIKVIGTEEIKPASFAIFYDDLLHPRTGGTGHTVQICEQNDIPFFDQKIWFKWLEEF